MTDEGFTLENIFIDGIGNQISNIILNSHNEMPMSVLSKDAIKDFLSLVIYPLMRRHIS